jgi:hypothetical protein
MEARSPVERRLQTEEMNAEAEKFRKEERRKRE